MNANVYQLFAARFPAERARVFMETDDGRAYTYEDLEANTARYARLLQGLGIAKGDRLVAQVEKSPDALFLYLGALRAGMAFVPLNPAYQRSEVEYFLADADPKVVVCSPPAEETVRPIAERANIAHVYTLSDTASGSVVKAARALGPAQGSQSASCAPGDLASILYTSGTTGRSKGAMLSHRNLASNALTLVDAWAMSGNDVLLHTLPIFHIHGLFVACHTALASGARMIFLKRFEAKRVIEYLPRATMFMGVPTYYTRLLQETALDASVCRNMRLFISGSAPLLTETFNEFRARTGHTILERYGMSETGMNTSNPLHGERKAGTVGLPLPGVEVRVADDTDQPVAAQTIGSIQVRGENVLRGYWRRPELTATEFTRDGYFRTGDVGKFDEAGYLTIVGRSKDVVITGGLNVYPKEIESYIDAMEGVGESAVIGVPHPDFGEAVVAVVILKSGAQQDESSVIQQLKAQVANFKVPKRVLFAAELPRNTMGKVQKNELRAAHAGLFEHGDSARK